MITAVFEKDNNFTESGEVWQWDYGQVLEIHGLALPPAIEIHFGIERGNSTITRIGSSLGGVTAVNIPDALLRQSRNLIVYIFVTSEGSGKTEWWIRIPVFPRPKPDDWEGHDDIDNPFYPAVESITALTERAELAEKAASEHAGQAEKYAEQAENRFVEISGKVSAEKRKIDQYCRQKEMELKGDTGNVYFASFAVVNGRLRMYSDPTIDKVRFRRKGSRLSYRLNI